MARLSEQRLVAVVGASGCGKTSLARAGVVPAVLPGALGPGWRAAVFVPGSDPCEALETALAGADDRLLLIADQFEQAFIGSSNPVDRARFFEGLLAAPGRVVLTLRADYYGNCATHPGLAEAVARHPLLLGPMDEAELREAVEGPAGTVGLQIEAGLTDLLVADVVGEPVGFPLLSHALVETWQRRSTRSMTLAGYRAAGGARGAIALIADRVYGDLDPEARAVARRLFLRLVDPGEMADTARRASRKEIRSAEGGATVVDDVLERLTAARLVTAEEGGVELAHEAVLREWPALRRWADADRETVRTTRHLTSAAQAWDATGRETSELYRGARLAVAGERLGNAALTELEQAFLAASESHADAERGELQARIETQARAYRRLRNLLGALVVALVAVLLSASVALVQQRRAERSSRRADISRLIAQAGPCVPTSPTWLGSSPSRPTALPTPPDAGAAARRDRGPAPPAPPTPLHRASRGDFCGDGRILVTTIDRVTVFDTGYGRSRAPSLGTALAEMAIAPDGVTYAVSDGAGAVEIHHGDLPPVRWAVPGGLSVRVIRFSPDGRLLAVGAAATEQLVVFDVATGTPLGPPIPVGGTAGGVASLSCQPCRPARKRRTALPTKRPSTRKP